MESVPSLSRATVLATAERLLAEGGPQALSVRRIAEELGVSRQIVYSRFRDKRGLVRALHTEGFRRLDARLRAVTTTGPARERVLETARAFRLAALASPALYEVMFGRPVMEFEPDEAARAVAEASFEPVIAATHAWVVSARRVLSRRSTLALAKAVWSVTHGVVSLELAGHLGKDAVAILERVVLAVIES